MHFILMYKNVPVSRINISKGFTNLTIEKVYNEAYLPLHVINANDRDKVCSEWFFKRFIPDHRDGIDSFKTIMQEDNLAFLGIRNRALSLTDFYWLKKENESVLWEDINFFDNDYSEEVGNAIFNRSNKKPENLKSPDLTTGGILKKAWRKKEDGEFYLYKMGSFPYYQEPLNEVFCSELAKRFCKIPFVEYSLEKVKGQYCSVCKNFVTKDVEFIPAYQIYNMEEKPYYTTDIDHLVSICKSLGMECIKKQIQEMLAFDYLIGNKDRHMGNFGFLRDSNTLEFIGMAPLFDNGSSLFDETIIKSDTEHSFQNEPFMNWQEEQIKLINHIDSLDIKAVKDMSQRLFEILSDAGISLEVVDKVCKNYDDRWNRLNKIILQKEKNHHINRDDQER